MLILREAEYDVDSHVRLSKLEASDMLAIRDVTMPWHGLKTFGAAPELYQHCIVPDTRGVKICNWKRNELKIF